MKEHTREGIIKVDGKPESLLTVDYHKASDLKRWFDYIREEYAGRYKTISFEKKI